MAYLLFWNADSFCCAMYTSYKNEKLTADDKSQLADDKVAHFW